MELALWSHRLFVGVYSQPLWDARIAVTFNCNEFSNVRLGTSY